MCKCKCMPIKGVGSHRPKQPQSHILWGEIPLLRLMKVNHEEKSAYDIVSICLQLLASLPSSWLCQEKPSAPNLQPVPVCLIVFLTIPHNYLWLNIASSHCQEESPKKSIPNCRPMFERGGDAPANQDGPKTKKLFLLPPIPTLTLTPSIQRFGSLQRVGYRTNYAFKRNFTPIARMSKLFSRVTPNIFWQCDKNSPKKYAAVSPLT